MRAFQHHIFALLCLVMASAAAISSDVLLVVMQRGIASIYKIAQSGIFKEEFAAFIAAMCAFLCCLLGARHVAMQRCSSLWHSAWQLACIAVFASLGATLCAGFPPLAGFLCRLFCPESLYFPKPLPQRSLSHSSHFSLGEMVALGTQVALAIAMAVEGMRLSVVLSSSCGGIVIGLTPWVAALFLVVSLRGRRNRPSKSRLIASLTYHAMEIWFWVAFFVVCTVRWL